MNHYISGILKIILLEGSIALLLVDALAGDRFERARARAHGVLAGLMVFAWANYGALRGGVSEGYVLTALPLILGCGWLVQAAFGAQLTERMKAFRAWGGARARWVAVALVVALSTAWVGFGIHTGRAVLVHQWEQFHFLLGAKYQRELGWFNLYKATILADRETAQVLTRLPTTRDLTTFEQVSLDEALRDADQVRGRFSPGRWEAFKADWAAMARAWNINWSNVMNDHGNSNSPAWALLAAPLAGLAPIDAVGQSWLGWLDLLLMLGLWLFVWQTFGHRAASMGLFFWATPPIVFDYLSGSFLRWDWLLALGLAAGFLKRGRYAVAGGCFGFAVATKLFPLFFGVALGLRALWEWRRTGRFEPRYGQFLKGAVLAGALSVAASAAVFGPSAWVEYAQRIQVAQVEKFYAIQYSLKTVYLQFAAASPQEWRQGLFPAELKQARRDVELKDYAFGFLLARLLFTALVAVLLRRADDVEAFVLGPLLVFTWLTVNMYYWNMLGLLALGLFLRARTQRPMLGMLIGLHAIFMTAYVYQHLNRGMSEGFAVAWLLCAWLIAGAAWEWREQRRLPQPG